jgi:hypothetical protein
MKKLSKISTKKSILSKFSIFLLDNNIELFDNYNMGW